MSEILDYQLLEFGKFSLKIHNLLGVIIIIILAYVALRMLTRWIHNNKKNDEGAKYSLNQLARYAIFILALILGILALGFNLSGFFVGSAALLVGIGFGLQHLFNDFISGIIILLDGTIKVQDVIEVDGIVSRVKEIKLRTTTVVTREDKYIILPNSVITQSNVVNWTYNPTISRFEVSVGIAYESDIPEVLKLLKTVALEHPAVGRFPEPSIRITEFADSGVIITVMFWCSEVFRVENIKSEIRISIFKALRANNITIPFPQRVLHIAKDEDFPRPAEPTR
jgi:small-conductance mechanosensitive channel